MMRRSGLGKRRGMGDTSLVPTRLAKLSALAAIVAVFSGSTLSASERAADPVSIFDRAPPGSPYADRGDVEQRMIERALTDRRATPVLDPWGRRVCAVVPAPYPVFLEENVLPTWLNVFHRTTRSRVIARGSMLGPGDTLDRRAFEEAERSLRDPFLFSVVAVIPVESELDDCVDVVIVVRDAWSLKAGWALTSNGSTITNLFLSGSEGNLFGTTDLLSLSFSRGIGSWEIGPTYLSRRFAGSKVTVYERFRLVFDRELGGVEGTRNELQVALPFRNSRQRWGWTVAVEHDDSLQRRYTGERIDVFQFGDERLEDRYRSRSFGVAAGVTRSWGGALKHRLTPGFAASTRSVTPEPRGATPSDDALSAYRAARLPRAETAVGPTLRYDFFRDEHFRLIDYATYGVAEELQRGHNLSVALRGSEPALGSDARFATVATTLSWRSPGGDDGFASFAFGHALRFDDHVTDSQVSGSVRLVTPRFAAGRFVARVVATELRRNAGNALLSVGGDNGLRGYPNGFMKGTRSMQANLEWRSKPVRILLTRLGGVVFVDTGAAWDEGDFVAYHPSVGVGFRLVIPSLGTTVRAGDLALPLRPVSSPVFSFGLEQVF